MSCIVYHKKCMQIFCGQCFSDLTPSQGVFACMLWLLMNVQASSMIFDLDVFYIAEIITWHSMLQYRYGLLAWLNEILQKCWSLLRLVLSTLSSKRKIYCTYYNNWNFDLLSFEIIAWLFFLTLRKKRVKFFNGITMCPNKLPMIKCACVYHPLQYDLSHIAARLLWLNPSVT